jgi:hypothetical protein
MNRRLVPPLCFGVFLFVFQCFLPRPYGTPIYPLRMRAQLCQAGRDWNKRHSPVYFARQVRHAVLPIVDSTIYIAAWRRLTYPNVKYGPVNSGNYETYVVLGRPFGIPRGLTGRDWQIRRLIEAQKAHPLGVE